jgi:hypothetical protein
MRHGFSRIFHHDLRHLERQLLLHEQAEGPLFHRLYRVYVTIGKCTDYATEHAARHNFARIVVKRLYIEILTSQPVFQPFAHFRKQHKTLPYLPLLFADGHALFGNIAIRPS